MKNGMTMKVIIIQDREAQKRILKKFDVLNRSHNAWLEMILEKELMNTIRLEVVR
jgi:hypothetical protein